MYLVVRLAIGYFRDVVIGQVRHGGGNVWGRLALHQHLFPLEHIPLEDSICLVIGGLLETGGI